MSLALRPALFWDADVQSIDLQRHRKQMIERIIMRGRLEEFLEMMQYYVADTVREEVLDARHLDKYTLAFSSSIIESPSLNSDVTNTHS